uniref:Uncharacterized protein n=1 Tax=Meloidogyne incognita TaxID=6306 RepID=A0A914NQY3_MELIC
MIGFQANKKFKKNFQNSFSVRLLFALKILDGVMELLLPNVHRPLLPIQLTIQNVIKGELNLMNGNYIHL